MSDDKPVQRWGNALLLLLLALVAYWPSMGNGWIWDDDHYVTGNRTLESVEGLGQIWLEPSATPQYYPMVHTSYWLERRIWGDVQDDSGRPGPNPFGYHLDNVLLHGLAALLLWRVLRLLAVPGAWLAAALFAVHPVTVESVAWVTERKNVLSAVFAFGSAWAWLRFAGFPLAPKPAHPDQEAGGAGEFKLSWPYYVLSFLLFGAALLSKSVTASMPLALMLICLWQGGWRPWAKLLSLLLMIPVGVVAGLHTASLERTQVNAEGPYWDFDFVERLLIAGRASWFYLQKLVWPDPLLFFYERWKPEPEEWWQWLFPAAVVAVLAGLWGLRKRIGLGPLIAFLFFGGTLFPALGFLNVYPHRFSWVADHFQYHACVGVLALFAAILAGRSWWTSAKDEASSSRVEGPLGSQWSPAALVLSLALLVVLGGLTWRQCGLYQNEEVLWQKTMEANPKAYAAKVNMAAIYWERNQLELAGDLYREALEEDPINHSALFALAQMEMQQGKLTQAGEKLQKLAAVYPGSWEASFGMSMWHLHRGQYPQAAQQARVALQVPARGPSGLIQRAKAGLNLGAAQSLQGQWPQAENSLRQAIADDPELAPAYAYLGEALARQGQGQQAVVQLQRALSIQGNNLDALVNLAWIFAGHQEASLRNGSQAVALAEAAARQTSFQFPPALDALAAAQAETGDFAAAQQSLNQAMALVQRQGNQALYRQMQQRLQRYRRRQPFRSPTGFP
ncbi:MAG: O-GlcNAc transferase [Planctomycetota bacterium]|nr:MAG: O-GlcNAc transferase [Planctomycetota bacterium]